MANVFLAARLSILQVPVGGHAQAPQEPLQSKDLAQALAPRPLDTLGVEEFAPEQIKVGRMIQRRFTPLVRNIVHGICLQNRAFLSKLSSFL
jgi:hypothetical protein